MNIKGLVKGAGFICKKNAPKILTGIGILFSIGTTVTACFATSKLSKITDETKDTLNKIKVAEEDAELKEKYSQNDAKKDKIICYAQTAGKIAKLYLPSIVLGGLSIASLIGSHNILHGRNVAIAGAYASLNKGFNAYRERVIGVIGEDGEKRIKYALSEKKIDSISVDENGKQKKKKENVDVIDTSAEKYNPFIRLFGITNKNWDNDADYNLHFLRSMEQHANDLLNADGYIFLNNVYRLLGYEETKMGQLFGWKKGSKVDFGIFNLKYSGNVALLSGEYDYNDDVVLDFQGVDYIVGELTDYDNEESALIKKYIKEQ